MQFFGILLIVVGIASIFAKDLIWKLVVFNNQLRGRASERTDVWDTWTTVFGAIIAVAGLIALLKG
ncbi:MAG TPA: hypothetical protein ENN19_07615 [Chloroflexi bacterium]|nr:hypothetical protein [Chloroflexota bacterium]